MDKEFDNSRSTDHRLIVVEEQMKTVQKAINEMSKELIRQNSELINLHKALPKVIADTISKELKPTLEDIADVERSILQMGEEMKAYPSFTDCNARASMYEDTNKRLDTVEEQTKVLRFAFEHPRLTFIFIFGTLYYSLSHDWVAEVILKAIGK